MTILRQAKVVSDGAEVGPTKFGVMGRGLRGKVRLDDGVPVIVAHVHERHEQKAGNCIIYALWRSPSRAV